MRKVLLFGAIVCSLIGFWGMIAFLTPNSGILIGNASGVFIAICYVFLTFVPIILLIKSPRSGGPESRLLLIGFIELVVIGLLLIGLFERL